MKCQLGSWSFFDCSWMSTKGSAGFTKTDVQVGMLANMPTDALYLIFSIAVTRFSAILRASFLGTFSKRFLLSAMRYIRV